VMNRQQRHRQAIMVMSGGPIYSNPARFFGVTAVSLGNQDGFRHNRGDQSTPQRG
jgi:hypothetical protein